MSRPRPQTPLRDLLRAGDPARDGREPGVREVARLRGKVLAAVPRRPWRRWAPAGALAAAAGLLLVVALAVDPEETRRTGLHGHEPAATGLRQRPGAGPPDTAGRRQVHFATEKGTRIIWVLHPDPAL